MEVRRQSKADSVSVITKIHYDPDGWQLRNPDARTIIPAFQQVFETDFSVHCDEEGKEYSTSYDTVRLFLERAKLDGNHIERIHFIIPVQGDKYFVTIDFRENTIYLYFDRHVEDDELSLFDPAMQRVSQLLSQNTQDGSFSFHKQIKKSEYNEHTPNTVEYIFHPASGGAHDMIVLEAFDQRFHLQTIYTEVWDWEEHFWRTFEGFDQYMKEAPTDILSFYDYLSELSFFIFIDGNRYRVSVDFNRNIKLYLSRIEITFETDHPYDFTPMMEELEKQISR